MLYHSVDTTIQVANLVNYNCPRESGKKRMAIKSRSGAYDLLVWLKGKNIVSLQTYNQINGDLSKRHI